MTQKEKQYCTRYIHANMHSLFEVYKNPSQAKILAYMNIKIKMIHDEGYDFRILSHNNQFFSCAYKIRIKDNSLSQYSHFLRVFTPTKNFVIKI